MPAKKIKSSVYELSKALVRLLLKIFYGCRYEFEEPLPRTGPLIIASNHLSYFDPPSVGAGVRREIYFMAKRELFSNPLFGALIRFYHAVPIRRGGMDWPAIARVREILQGGGAIILFPEGTRQKEGHLGKPRFGVGLLAQETRSVIVPVYTRGTNSLLAAFLRRDPIRIRYGRSIQPEEYAGFEATPRGQLEISKLVMQRIAALKEISDRLEK